MILTRQHHSNLFYAGYLTTEIEIKDEGHVTTWTAVTWHGNIHSIREAGDDEEPLQIKAVFRLPVVHGDY